MMSGVDDKALWRVVRALRRPGACLIKSPRGGGEVRDQRDQRRRVMARCAAPVFNRLQLLGLVRAEGPVWRLSAAGKAWQPSSRTSVCEAVQTAGRSPWQMAEDGQAHPLPDRRLQSAVDWLSLRRDKDGWALTAAEHQAAETLRADCHQAGFMGQGAVNWLRVGGSSGHGLQDQTDHRLAARQRVMAALQLLTKVESAAVMDICVQQTALSAAERKLDQSRKGLRAILKAALNRLAGHYGYAAKGRGDRLGR